jgi:alpha-glucosidase
MQWDASAAGGFTGGAPWLPLAEDAVHQNVENLAADTRSILSLYRALIDLRKTTPQLVAGGYIPVVTTGDLLAYRRESGEEALLIVLNLADDPISIASDAIAYAGEILLSTHLDRTGETVSGSLDLRGDEGLIIRLR